MSKLLIVGYGKMANAVIEGLGNRFEIEVSGRDEEKLQKLKAKYPNIDTNILSNVGSIEDREILLCIKPYALDEVALFLQGEAKALYSVLAGVSIERLKSKINAKAYIRAMPNIAALYQKSATSLCGDEFLKERAKTLFETLGEVFWLDKEEKIDIATALAGSSPAFFALVVEAMVDGAVREGLDRDTALRLTRGALDGSAELLKHKDPSVIKNEVMSPAGTTARGIASLEEHGVRYAFMEAIRKSFERARELI